MLKNYTKHSLFTLTLLFLSACTPQPETSKSNIAAEPITKEDLNGEWYIEYIEGSPVFDRSPATLNFAENNQLSGNASCNRIMSSYSYNAQENDKIVINAGAVTQKMCFEASMRQEQKYLAALPKVTNFDIKNEMLLLMDDDEKVMFKASKIVAKVKQ